MEINVHDSDFSAKARSYGQRPLDRRILLWSVYHPLVIIPGYAAKPVSRFLIQYDIDSRKNILWRRDIGTDGISPASALLYTVQGE